MVADDGNANDLDHDKCEDDEHDHSNCENDVNFEDIGFVFENCGSLAILLNGRTCFCRPPPPLVL